MRGLRRRAAMNIETMIRYICKPSLEVIPHPEVEIQFLKQVYYNHQVWKLSFYGCLCHGRKQTAFFSDRYYYGAICFSRGAEIRPDATASLERRGWNHAVFVAAKFSLATALPQECNYWFTRACAWLHNSRRWPRGQHG